jgi:hydrogenase maturation protein HypF
MHLTNSKVEVVACDLHPKFNTTSLARELAEQNGWQLIQIQHHHAHVAALMAEFGVSEVVGIACDGYGYGTDGSAWGGEILLCKRGLTGFKRLGHLESQPLLGGDAATKYPARIAAGILGKKTNIDRWLIQNSAHLPHGETEAHLILRQLTNPRGLPETTSLGRVLDAAAAVLGLCYERTFEGEAAMKLESAALGGKDVLGLSSIIRRDELDTTRMLFEAFEARSKYSQADLAYSVHAYLAKGLATLAVENAIRYVVGNVGFTGGVAVNGILAKLLREVVETAGLRFLVHESIPPGDGGLSLGQAVVGGF